MQKGVLKCVLTADCLYLTGKSSNRQRAFDFGRVFSVVKIECPLSIT